MNPNTLVEDQVGTLLLIDANPTPLRLPIGSAIFAYTGEVWITQEGMRDDVILGAGERFDVLRSDLILASATKRGTARLYIACATDAVESAERNLFALLNHRARRLRAEHFNRVAQAVRKCASSGLAAVSVYVRRMLAASRVTPSCLAMQAAPKKLSRIL